MDRAPLICNPFTDTEPLSSAVFMHPCCQLTNKHIQTQNMRENFKKVSSVVIFVGYILCILSAFCIAGSSPVKSFYSILLPLSSSEKTTSTPVPE